MTMARPTPARPERGDLAVVWIELEPVGQGPVPRAAAHQAPAAATAPEVEGFGWQSYCALERNYHQRWLQIDMRHNGYAAGPSARQRIFIPLVLKIE